MSNAKFKKIKLLALDFDGVMTDNKVLVDENGKEAVFCNRSDSLGMEMIKKKGVEVVVISKEKNKVVEERCKKLKIKCLYGIENKKEVLIKEAKKLNFELKNICFIGNDLPDLDCIKMAGIGVAVNDSYGKIKECADFITQKKGGEGAIREVCDLIIEEQNS